MKIILFFLAFSFSTMATEYSCIDRDRSSATLIIDFYTNRLVWMKKSAPVTNGVFKNIENAPFSEWKGYQTYQLVQWPSSADSSWKLAIDFKSVTAPKVVVYFDNDDHEEKVSFWQCYKRP